MTAPIAWPEVWAYVKANLPEWRVEAPMGAIQKDGGRLLRLRSHGQREVRSKAVYLDADGGFVEVAKDESMGGWWPGSVTLVDGRVIG